MPRKKKEKPTESMSQALQLKSPPVGLIKPYSQKGITVRMNLFIRAFEKHCGNVSLACLDSEVSRRTYYRWINGTAPIYLRFQRKIAKVQPRQKLLDAAHAVVQHHLQEKNLTAAMFTINTYKDEPKQDTAALDRVVEVVRKWLENTPDADEAKKQRFLTMFAETARVDRGQLARRVGIGL